MTNQNQNDVTIAYDLVTPHSNHPVPFLIEAIRSKQYKITVDAIRFLLEGGNKEAAGKLKKSLPAATFSCRYKERRCAENVTHYTGMVLLDADHLDAMTLIRCSAMLRSCPWVYAFFISPGGRGLKILVKTSGLQEHHAATYKEVTHFFSKMLKITFDASTSDIVRLCFLSYDPNAYINPGALTFQVAPPFYSASTTGASTSLSDRYRSSRSLSVGGTTDYTFKKCVRFTNRKRSFVEGNRNNFVFLLSCYCRLNGLTLQDATDAIVKHYNYSQREIKSAVKSAYRYK